MKLYEKTDAAEYLHISLSTLNTLIAAKRISYFKNPGLRGRVLFSQEHLDKYLEFNQVEAMERR